MKISAVILTKNEETNIARAIDSCLTFCDEILVIDSGSTDKTQAVCESYPEVKFIATEWRGFSETKNFGNKHATGDYILSIDADEALDHKLQQSILNIKSQLNGAYQFKRLTNYCGQWIHHSGWRPDYQMRLFPRLNTKWNSSLVHEKVILPDDVKIQTLPGDLLHYSYKNISEHLKKLDTYSTLGAQMVLKKDKTRFLVLQAIFRSKFKFFRTYFLKRGFLDGFNGFLISALGAFVVFLKYIKAAQAYRQRHSPTPKD